MKGSVLTIFVTFLILGFYPASVRADDTFRFSEIMYDLSGTDTDHEWVELQNTSGASITILGGNGAGSYRFNDGSNHILSGTVASGSFVIPNEGYFVLAGNAEVFMTDYPNFSGTLIDTTMSLSNEQDTLTFINGDGTIVASVTYANTQGANGNGNSLQRNSSGTWIEGVPTPGIETQSTTSGGSGGGTTGTTTVSTEKPKVVEIPKMRAKVITENEEISGMPILVVGEVYGYEGALKTSGVFSYSFGDGTSEVSNTNEKVQHVYANSGIYVISFSYRANSYQIKPEISAKKTIEIKDPKLIISEVKNDGAIVLKNPSDVDMDISGWAIHIFGNNDFYYHFPEGMIIVGGGTISLSKNVTKLEVNEKSEVELALPSGINVYTYRPVVLQSAKTFSSSQTENKQIIQIQEPDVATGVEDFETTNLGASVIDSVSKNENNKSSFWYFVLGLVGVVGTSLLALRIQNKKEDAGGRLLNASESETQKIADSIRIVESEEED